MLKLSRVEVKLKVYNDSYAIAYVNEPYSPDDVKQVEKLFEGVHLEVYPNYIVIYRSTRSYLKPEYRDYFPSELKPSSNPVPWGIIGIAIAIGVIGMLAYFIPEFREWLRSWIEKFLYVLLVGTGAYLGVVIGKELLKD